MPSILFICTANRFRSPLSAASFSQIVSQNEIDEDLEISSAGTWTQNAQPATLDAIKLAEAQGLDLTAHRSREITAEILKGSDLIIVMVNGHKEAITHEFPECKERVFLLTEAVGEPPSDIPDPYLNGEPANIVASEIFELIEQGYEKLIDLANQISDERTGLS